MRLFSILTVLRLFLSLAIAVGLVVGSESSEPCSLEIESAGPAEVEWEGDDETPEVGGSLESMMTGNALAIDSRLDSFSTRKQGGRAPLFQQFCCYLI